MDGKLGRSAWRWLFYIEGALTIFVALCAMFILPDFPATTGWLSEDERRLAKRRMEEDAGVGDERETEVGGHAAGLRMAVTDWKVWWMAVAMTSEVIALSFNAYFPTLSATMGFNPTVTLLLCAPPFVFTAIMAFVVSRYAHLLDPRLITEWNYCTDTLTRQASDSTISQSRSLEASLGSQSPFAR